MAEHTPSSNDRDAAYKVLESYLEDSIQPLIGMKTVQILLLREALDYLVLRTEDTREINEVTTPSRARNSKGDVETKEIRRVAFLGGKQKAVESREFERLLREAWKSINASVEQKKLQGGKDCYLKDNLCLSCPRCALFGATSTESGKGDKPNIKHRIEYSTAFSLLPYEEVTEEITFNAINDDKQTTGQALGTRACVRPGTLFASIVTLRSATQRELVLALKTLLSARSYGAESRTSGDVRNHIVGIIGGWEEVLTPLEFTLECEQRLEAVLKEATRPGAITEIVDAYWKDCADPSRVVLLNTTERKEEKRLAVRKSLTELVDAVRYTAINDTFLRSAYADVAGLRAAQGV
jgi:CRISPR type I-D-associated protein Csc2